MRRAAAVALVVVAVAFARAEDASLEGAWNGKLETGAVPLSLVLHFEKSAEGKLSATMDSPDQNAFGIPADDVKVEGTSVVVLWKKLGARFKGKLADDVLDGTWKQGGGELALTLRRGDLVRKRPQEPKRPFPYKEIEVSYDNPKAPGVTLAGTLTVPAGDGPFPAVLLITGSGPQDRDETILGHKPFLIISDHLTRKGIAVLRVDDRGVAKSTGKTPDATTEDFATDAEAGVAFLKTRKEVDPARIGLLGHSEGGVIAPMLAVRSKDIAFIVMLSGPALPGDEIIRLQSELIEKAMGAPAEVVAENSKLQRQVLEAVKTIDDPAAREKRVREILKDLPPAQVEKSAVESRSAWFHWFLAYDPRPTLAQVKCPALALFGEKDLQVPADENIAALEKTLGKEHPSFVVKKLPGVNHLFQTCKTGAPSEYASIEETISPAALDAISGWLTTVTAKK
jgi:pimeloyl-ACP methyl ester carboxylesterase